MNYREIQDTEVESKSSSEVDGHVFEGVRVGGWLLEQFPHTFSVRLNLCSLCRS